MGDEASADPSGREDSGGDERSWRNAGLGTYLPTFSNCASSTLGDSASIEDTTTTGLFLDTG